DGEPERHAAPAGDLDRFRPRHDRHLHRWDVGYRETGRAALADGVAAGKPGWASQRGARFPARQDDEAGGRAISPVPDRVIELHDINGPGLARLEDETGRGAQLAIVGELGHHRTAADFGTVADAGGAGKAEGE